MYVSMCEWMCVRVNMDVCMCEWMRARVCEWMCVCVNVCVNRYVYVNGCVNVCEWLCVCVATNWLNLSKQRYVQMMAPVILLFHQVTSD